MDGILLIDKPHGWSSFDVVNKVRRLLQNDTSVISAKKRFPVGHTGTLDPFATGLLVLLLGNYTKKAPELTKLDKEYMATAILGKNSTTGDEEGVKASVSGKIPLKSEIESALGDFLGESSQVPPIYSAIKVNGVRAYKLARSGKSPELKPRPISINKISLLSYSYPEIEFIVQVSSGTYIRTLAEDIGKKLGTGAYVSSLRRTKVGNYKIEDSLQMEGLTVDKIKSALLSN